MRFRGWIDRLARWALLGLALTASACAHANRGPAPARVPAPQPRPPADPTGAVIAEAERALQAGLAEARAGHLVRARAELDRAVDTYLTAPGGAFAAPRLADAYRRTLETIHLWELESLAAGDGFTEQRRSEPAAIDQVADLTVGEAPPSEDLRRTTEAAVRAEANDFPVELNDAVLACVDLYTGKLRDWFAAALARGARYLPRIREVFAAAGIPRDLAYIAMVESAFKPAALSRAKARGVWQFIPETGRRYGLDQDWWVDERSDPDKATLAAARYLKELYGMFGDWNLAMAAYNAGEMNVQRGLARYKATDFWQLARTRALRRETRNYVPLIHAAIVVAKAPESYGFSIQPEAQPAFESLTVNGAVDLRVVSECAGASLDEVQQLNPSLRRLATPADRPFDLKLPEGTASTVATCIESTPPEKRVRFRTHAVAKGQTLSTIAARYGVRTTDLASANRLASSGRLTVGQELIIPIDPRVAAAQPAPRPPAQPATGAVKVAHRIRPGDTLAAIASQYGTTIRELQSWNGLQGTRIVAGDVLTIFANRGF